jgi:hypothetical protein
MSVVAYRPHRAALPAAGEQAGDGIDLVAQPQAHIGRNLIVPRSRRMQPLAGIAYQFGEPPLDVHVHVLRVQRPREAGALDFAQDGGETPLDRAQIGRRENSGCAQHACMSDRSTDVVSGQPLVEADRGCVAFNALGHRFGKAARPGRAAVPCGRAGRSVLATRLGYPGLVTSGRDIGAGCRFGCHG